MRFRFLMIIATCWLCLQFNKCVQFVRPGSDGEPIYDLPAVTQEEMDAAHAARAAHPPGGVAGRCLASALQRGRTTAREMIRPACLAPARVCGLHYRAN